MPLWLLCRASKQATLCMSHGFNPHYPIPVLGKLLFKRSTDAYSTATWFWKLLKLFLRCSWGKVFSWHVFGDWSCSQLYSKYPLYTSFTNIHIITSVLQGLVALHYVLHQFRIFISFSSNVIAKIIILVLPRVRQGYQTLWLGFVCSVFTYYKTPSYR